MEETEASSGDIFPVEDDQTVDEEKNMENVEADEVKESVDEENLEDNKVVTSTTTGIEYSFGTFFNWFMPSCMDLWTTEDNVTGEVSGADFETIIAYGARSYLFLLDVKRSNSQPQSARVGRLLVDEASAPAPNYGIHYRDLVNVFNHSASKKFTDVFRSTNAYVTTVVFEKTKDFVGRNHRSLTGLKDNHGPRVFVGNSDGNVAIYDLHKRTTILQDLPFPAFKRPCCRKVGGGQNSKILSASWMHFSGDGFGSVVFYPLDCHLIRWEVEKNIVSVVHYQERECGSARLFGQLPISCLAAMSAEMTVDKSEHRLAVGFNSGKLALFSFDRVSGEAKSLVLLTDNSHHDDICSLAFSSYAVGSVSAYRSGLLASVSRDSMLKVWSLAGEGAAEIAEYRIAGGTFSGSSGGSSSSSSFSSFQSGKGKGGGSNDGGANSKCNWFAASFLPRSAMQNSGSSQASAINKASYEILVTSPTGELVTITLPEKAPNAKLRIAKAGKFTSGSGASRIQKGGDAHYGHQSVVFSIMVNGKAGIAVTYSLDYKMILWDLSLRSARSRFNLFANGALAIDSCLKDRRLAIAFGSSVYTLDFGDTNFNQDAAISTSRLATAPRSWKYYQVSWNNMSDSERLGSLALGNSNGEVLHFDLNERTFIGGKGGGRNPAGFHVGGKGGSDASKIYKFVWPVKVKVDDTLRTAVLSLHASGTILINYVPSRHAPNRPAENFMTPKFVSGLPTVEGGGLLNRKHSALDGHDRGRYLVVGNDDGTVDLLKSVGEDSVESLPPYRHLFRFRAFTKPIISIEAAAGEESGLWFAITAMHDNFVHCYKVENEALSEDFVKEVSSEEAEEKFAEESSTKHHPQPIKYKLSGHSDRVAATSWSPFTSSDGLQKKLLATASYDTTCIIWDVMAQTPLRRFHGHRSLIYAIKWSHFREDLIFSGGEDAFHAWRWPEQPTFEDDGAGGGLTKLKSSVKVIKLRDMIKKEEEVVEDGGDHEKSNEKEKIEKKEETVKNSKVTTSSFINISTPAALLPAKALFSLSNQIEYNSSKTETLEDICNIVRLKTWYEDEGNESPELAETLEVPEEIVPGTSLGRIFLYSPRVAEVLRFLAAERANHLKNGRGAQTDPAEVISMMVDLKVAIEKAIEEGEADLALATFASAFSRKLYFGCMEAYWTSRRKSGSSAGVVPSRCQRLLLNYGREMEALSRLAVFGDFEGAFEGLLSPKSTSGGSSALYREALVLAKVNLASEPTIACLWDRWYMARLEAGQTEGAVKCLVAAGKWAEALGVLEARRKLCADTSGEKVLEAYKQVIGLLREKVEAMKN